MSWYVWPGTRGQPIPSMPQGYYGPDDSSFRGHNHIVTMNEVNKLRASGQPSGWVGYPGAERAWTQDARNTFMGMQRPQGGVYPGGWF
ncbi:unnamed protein product [Cercospora beticola]|nr:unnamed protein product [Cercospora beticola]